MFYIVANRYEIKAGILEFWHRDHITLINKIIKQLGKKNGKKARSI